jgi:hypothetical protein
MVYEPTDFVLATLDFIVKYRELRTPDMLSGIKVIPRSLRSRNDCPRFRNAPQPWHDLPLKKAIHNKYNSRPISKMISPDRLWKRSEVLVRVRVKRYSDIIKRYLRAGGHELLSPGLPGYRSNGSLRIGSVVYRQALN